MNLYIKIISLGSFLLILCISLYTFVSGGVADTRPASDAYFDESLRAIPISLSVSDLAANNCLPGRTYRVVGTITSVKNNLQLPSGESLFSLVSDGNSFPLISAHAHTGTQSVTVTAVCIAKSLGAGKGYAFYLFE